MKGKSRVQSTRSCTDDDAVLLLNWPSWESCARSWCLQDSRSMGSLQYSSIRHLILADSRSFLCTNRPDPIGIVCPRNRILENLVSSYLQEAGLLLMPVGTWSYQMKGFHDHLPFVLYRQLDMQHATVGSSWKGVHVHLVLAVCTFATSGSPTFVLQIKRPSR